MTNQELKVLSRIPKKYREHIVSLTIEPRDCHYYSYIVEWDNGTVHTFESQDYMLFYIRVFNVDGYCVAP